MCSGSAARSKLRNLTSTPTTFPMTTTVKKTYHKRTRTIAPVSSSSPASPVLLSPAHATGKRAREENDDGENIHPAKRQNTTVKTLSTITNKNKRTPPSRKPHRKPFTQLQLALSTQPAFRSCGLCGLSYTRGTPEDESLHRSHCARVTKGMEWGREEEKESGRAGVSVVRDDVKLKGGEHGRIISFRADVSGKIGTKVSLLQVAGAEDFDTDDLWSYLQTYLRSISRSQLRVSRQERWPLLRLTCSLYRAARVLNANALSGA